MIAFLITVILIISGIILFLRTPVFGKISTGDTLKRLQQSPNFHTDHFQNKSVTPNFKEGTSIAKVMADFFFNRSPQNKPKQALPSQKTDLHLLSRNEDVLIWFGHSSYFFQLNGKRFLVDPVLSGHASPVSFLTKSFPGTDIYTVSDIPHIDYLLLTHDHYDHLDYKTVNKLKDKVANIITGIGVGTHLCAWGFSQNSITEMDWDEHYQMDDSWAISTVTARHFSGRSTKRNTSLWLSFVLETKDYRMFIGGDSGFDDHFKQAGNKFGSMDLAILECGQYNEYWKYIHMMPEEVMQAAKDLKAKKLLPVHWAKFALSLHSWKEPIERVTKEAEDKDLAILTPMIGEKLCLRQDQRFSSWWNETA